METGNVIETEKEREIKEFVQCAKCGEKVEKEEFLLSPSGKEGFCVGCYDEKFISCSDCEEAFERGEGFVTHDEKSICEKCYSDSYACCRHCDEIFHTDNFQTGPDDSDYCNGCADDLFTACEGCSRNCLNADTHYSDEDGQYYCDNCFDGEGLYWKSDVSEIPSKSFEKIKNGRFFGLELESSAPCDRLGQKETSFSAVSDNSISGPEYVSPKLQGDDGFREVEKICSFHPSVNRSCGLHVHLDARDLSRSDIVKIARGYQVLEDFLFHLVARSRWDSSFCSRIQTDYFSIKDAETELFEFVYGKGASPSVIGDKYHGKRYEFLNVHSYFFRKTLEIRLHQGSFNPLRIRNWVNLHLSLFEFFLARPLDFSKNGSVEEILPLFVEGYDYLRPYLIERLGRFKHPQHELYLRLSGKEVK